MEADVGQVRASWREREARAGTPPRRAPAGAARGTTAAAGGRSPVRANGGGSGTTPPRQRSAAGAGAGAGATHGAGAGAQPQALGREPPPLAGLSGSIMAARSAARTLKVKADLRATQLNRAGTILIDEPEANAAADDGMRVEREFDGLLDMGGPTVLAQTTAQKVAAVLSMAALVALVAAVVLSVLWGSDIWGSANCGGRTCTACAEHESCTWCPGPDVATMPGYCELSTLNSDSTCGQPSVEECVREDVEEERWKLCGAQKEAAGCEIQTVGGGGQGCQWCNKTATQLACVPHDSGTNASFCDPDDLIFGALRPFALSSRTPSCVQQGAHPTHVDRSGNLARDTAVHPQALAVNNSYTEGLTCVWVIECPFNTSVETRIAQVNMGAADSLRIYDGWDARMSSQLAYFKDFAGDRSGEFSNAGGGFTSVSGGPSARLLISTTPLLAIQLKTGSSEVRRAYTRTHGRINFAAEERYEGFSLTHRCVVPPASFTAGVGLLGVWWLLAISGLTRAYWRINYGAKSGGLWKMNVVELSSIADAMGLDADIDGDGDVDKSELIAAITQSPQWPAQIGNGLALSSFETLSTDSEPGEWINVSFYSPVFILDLFSCIACTFEGFCDLLFVVLQFQRPNGSGTTTGTLSLCITCLSTLFHISPAGKGILSSTVLRDVMPYAETKQWVKAHARTESGQPLASKEDWNKWLASPAGKHRPNEITSVPNIEFKKSKRPDRVMLKGLKKLKNLVPLRGAIGAMDDPVDEDGAVGETSWVSWGQFLGVEGMKQKSVKTMRNLSEYISAAEKDSGEPGWLCGSPPQTQWDSDAAQVLYGRVSTPLMYLLTILQLRVPVEGIIAWRNVKMLKSKTKLHDEKSCGMASISVRGEDFERARCELDKALLREAIFEVLPQAVLEFQNLWADEYAVLDLMSVPGVPFLTSISEYQLTFLIMCSTIITSTVDISTPYASVSPLVGIALSASACIQLTSRLLVFGAVLSMEPEGKKTSTGLAAVLFFFAATFACTVGIHLFCSKKKLYHRGDAAFRARTATANYKVSVRTEASVGSGTTARARITLHGEQASQSLEVGGSQTSGRKPVQVGDDGVCTFEPGSTRTFSVECAELGSILRMEISHDSAGSSPDWNCHAVTVTHEVTQKKWGFDVARWISDAPEHGIAHTIEVADEKGEVLDDAGLAVFNMQSSSRWEKLVLFAFINLFTTTDKNVTTSPTSRGTLILAFWRIIEAVIVCVVLVPKFGAGQDSDGDGEIDRVSAFQIKAFLAVYLSLGSFSCLLAASLAEKIVVMDRLRTKMGRLVDSVSGQNTAFLYVQLVLMLLVAAFAAQILYEVYLLGDTGARRCRSVVLLSLLSAAIVAFVCIRQAGTGGRFFWERRSTPAREAGTAICVVFFLIAGAYALGAGDGVDLDADLDGNPFKIVTSRCHPAQEWKAEIMRTVEDP